MTATNLHSDDNELPHRRKLGAEGSVRRGIPEAEPNRAVGADNLEQDGKLGEVARHQAVALADAQKEEGQEHIPQIERKLTP